MITETDPTSTNDIVRLEIPPFTTELPKHHVFGPSKLKNLEICPAWENDRLSDKTAAEEGTKLHLSNETNNLTGLTEEQAQQVQKCIDYVARLLKQKPKEDHKEVRLVFLQGQTFGTADRVLIYQNHADVIDYKFGWGEIDDAEFNRQGYAYVSAVFDRWPGLETVTLHFLVPRRNEIFTHTFRRKDYAVISAIVSSIIAQARRWRETLDESMLRMEETNCLYCGRKATCPKMREFAIAHAREYAPLEIAEEVHSSRIEDPEQMAQLYTAARILEKMVESVKKHIVDFARNKEIPGYKLTERKGQIRITAPILAWPAIKKVFEIKTLEDVDALMGSIDFDYNGLVKEITANVAGKDKTKKLAELWLALSDACAVHVGDPTAYLRRTKDPLKLVKPAPVPAIGPTAELFPDWPDSSVKGEAVS